MKDVCKCNFCHEGIDSNEICYRTEKGQLRCNKCQKIVWDREREIERGKK
ncbi:MAG: hypothetical protein PHE59_00125 [Patescibacteria group bacterium]|nr:hypothetical protein [Patescibacteria group bacterium]MDD5164577.1 hypothetical protein [Patescibacteria group bacterium]MDD5534332.1 hypothetical protein [Patescibacteria group bacterium]